MEFLSVEGKTECVAFDGEILDQSASAIPMEFLPEKELVPKLKFYQREMSLHL